jgi:hypothetical protein
MPWCFPEKCDLRLSNFSRVIALIAEIRSAPNPGDHHRILQPPRGFDISEQKTVEIAERDLNLVEFGTFRQS